MTDRTHEFDYSPDRPTFQQRALCHPSRRSVLAGVGALAAASYTGIAASGADTPRTNGKAASARDQSSDAPAEHDVSPADIEALIDRQMADAVDEGDIVGATVAVTHGDAVVLTKGYGRITPDDGEPVDETTLFRIGSVTKPIIWTAAMQLIDAGTIDPDEDVRTYLDSVSIPDDEPITMADLATHTAGFEERNQGLWVSDPEERRPLVDVLDAEQPARIRSPGEVLSYSNYGTALAGQIVANAAGQELDAYIREHVFDPLGMDTASVTQPADPPATQGYTALTGSPTAAPGLGVELWPAGSMTASARDMGQFMRAHIADTALGEQGLSLDVVTRMQEQWFTHHPTVDGVGFGWIERTHGGVRTLWHNGAIPGSFYSHLVLVPEADLGLFVSYNTDAGAEAANELVDAVLDESIGAVETPDREPSGRPDHADELAGTYRGLRIADTSHSKLFTTLQAGEIDVAITDNYLITEIGGESTRWIQRESLVFDEAEGQETLAFSEDLSRLYVGHQAFERRSWTESAALHGVLGAGSALGILGGAIGPPLAAGVRRFRSSEGDDSREDGVESVPEDGMAIKSTETTASSGESESNAAGRTGNRIASGRLVAWLESPTVARRTILIAAGLVVTFVVGFGAGLVFDPTLLSEPPLWYRLLLVVPPIATLVMGVSIGSAAVAWRHGLWRRRSLIAYGMLAVSTAVTCWLLYYWNLFGTPG
ncbi:serine hydrolase domain-containing protein [Halalkalicoccus tibetensis]|uniref:Serine hydrolase domain-containing protein n=1 Tax=Halalkalicoccus tibetensis TaxID=175632 RepID=A0ABD5V5V0_9EURY